mgnify:FL=1
MLAFSFVARHRSSVVELTDRGDEALKTIAKIESRVADLRQRRRLLDDRLRQAAGADKAFSADAPADAPADTPAVAPSQQLREKDIVGLKYFDMLMPLLERLHKDGCQRDKAKQRELHYDQYCMLVLLYMFNPTVTSLRAIEQASALSKVQKKFGCKRTSLSSLSEASRIFDSHRLKEIIAELGVQAHSMGRDKRLSGIEQNITLVDGSLVSAMPSLMQASLLKSTEGSGLVKWRLHTHFEVDRYVPTRIDVTPDGGGEYDERAVLERTLDSDRLYVMDRGYAKFALFNSIIAKKSSYVCRLRDNSAYEVVETGEVTTGDHKADE